MTTRPLDQTTFRPKRPVPSAGAARAYWVWLACLALLAADARALWVPTIFSDHAVLQREQSVPVWGKAEPGATVSVRFGDHKVVTSADDDGRWRVDLPAMPASHEPRELVVASGDDTQIAKDVLVGEVWLCSGQSNMDWRLQNADERDAMLADADQLPGVRFFRIDHAADFAPRSDVWAQWRISGHESTRDFSAVAYSMARRLNERLGVPVGVLQASIGGTGVQAWTDPRAAEAVAALGPDRLWRHFADRRYAARERASLNDVEAWAQGVRPLADTDSQADLPDPPAWPQHDAAQWNRPGAFHHAMIAPLAPYALRGFAWYQGEHNVGESDLYAGRLTALLHGWRSLWNDPHLPALVVHLPAFRYSGRPERDERSLARLVEAQQHITARPPNFGVVISDLSDLNDIHPRRKRAVGERIADQYLAAYTDTFPGRPIGPRITDVRFEADHVVVGFQTQGALATRDGHPPNWFELAGVDRAFHPAEATIGGDDVTLRSASVHEPIAMRFAFHEEAIPNLTDDTGLPAMAFRTDDWPEPFTTQQRVTLPLWPDGGPLSDVTVEDEITIDERVRNISDPTIELFFPRGFGDGTPRSAVLIFPGGGYRYLSIDHEGKRVARRLNGAGIIAGVVKSRIAPYRAPVPWLDAAQAIRLVRTHAADLGIDPQRVGVLGFSAGGHIAACASVLPDDASRALLDGSTSPELSASARPNFTVLVYPVVSMHLSVSHGGSARNLLGPSPTDEVIDAWSADLHVDADTPPALLVHCANDGVSIANSERYVAALKRHGVPHEFLRYETGGHGFGLAGDDHPAAGWIDRAIAWIEALPDGQAPENIQD